MSKPICEKHGCEKVWAKDRQKKAGGVWRCRQCKKESDARLNAANPGRNAKNCARWYQNNKEQSAKTGAKWYQENKDKMTLLAAEWRAENRDKVAAIKHKRRARESNAIVTERPVTGAVATKRKALFSGCCYCGSQEKLTLEHVIALDAGGLHVEENLLGACGPCNFSKNNRPVEEWYRAQPFFSEQRWQEIVEATAPRDMAVAAADLLDLTPQNAPEAA
jgi:hypothetical protein